MPFINDEPPVLSRPPKNHRLVVGEGPFPHVGLVVGFEGAPGKEETERDITLRMNGRRKYINVSQIFWFRRECRSLTSDTVRQAPNVALNACTSVTKLTGSGIVT